VKNPSEYAVVEFDRSMNVLSIEEKPVSPKTKYAVPGIYKLDQYSAKYAKTLKPSKRRELEIVDLLKLYIENQNMKLSLLGEGFVWLDAGLPSMLYQASAYVQTVQERQGKKIGCIEEDAYKMGFINDVKFKELISNTPKGEYREYLEQII
jgi:glucose-1-phosphate thymidylyltransferase